MAIRALPLPGTIILIAIVAWLGWAYFSQPQKTLHPASLTQTAQPSSSDISTDNGVRNSAIHIYVADITKRPLFEPTRRPLIEIPPEPEIINEAVVPGIQPPIVAPEPKLIPEQVALLPPEFHLNGVLIQNTGKSALLSIEEGEPVWVDLDNFILEWKLHVISPNYVELVNEDETIRLLLHPDN